MARRFHIQSFNVNGLGQETKRIAIFNKLKKADSIILLQETHSTPSCELKWKSEWGGDILFSHGESNSRGVAILIPLCMEYEILEQVKDDNGRFLLLKLKTEELEYVIGNIYSPTRDHKKDQLNFIRYVKEQICQFENETFLIGGDYNFYIDPKMDKLSTMSDTNDNPEYREEILSMMETLNLVDCWRIFYPDTRRYTWHSRGKASRLDYLFLSEHLLNEICKCDILPGILSDHSIIEVILGGNTHNRGRGLWKFNISLLHDVDYVVKMKNLIRQCKDEYRDIPDKGLVWEMCKMRIRSETIPYCVKKKKERTELKSSLESELKNLETMMNEQRPEIIDQYNITKKELTDIEIHEANGSIFRSKAKWSEDGEKNSKFFMNLEKRNFVNKLITQLEVDGNIITDPSEILKEEKRFYEKLYKENLDTHDPEYIYSTESILLNDIKKLTDEEKELCDAKVTEKEILNSLKELKNGRTPGSDGLPSDFYKFFWSDIKDLVCNSIEYALTYGELSIEQKRGIITLLPKKLKNRLFLKNWRPISLLNTDYKLLAKILAKRLQKVLPSIINHDQTGYLKGRFIGENIRLLEDVLFFTNAHNLPGIIITVDFEKAFDSLNWNYLENSLKKFNFGSQFIRYIKTMYNNIQSAVTNNGHLSDFFDLERGVRQGCPLSAYLFLIAIETLGHNIRCNDNIKGISIHGQNIKVSQLADDMTCYLENSTSIEHLYCNFNHKRNLTNVYIFLT